MVKKILGYIIAIIGIIGLAFATIKPLRTSLAIIPSQLTDTTLLIISLVVVIIGIFFIYKTEPSKSSRLHEVPIYHGEHIVGYRRVAKK